MSITRSYNKYTDTYYAYDTVYVWDEKTQKKVQQKKCIGKYDPNTGEIIPTGKRGRPSKETVKQSSSETPSLPSTNISELISKTETIYASLDAIEGFIGTVADDIKSFRKSVDELVKQLHIEE